MHGDRVFRAAILVIVSKKNHYKLKAKVYHWVRCLTLLSFSHRPLLFFTKRPTLISFTLVCTHVTSWLGLNYSSDGNENGVRIREKTHSSNKGLLKCQKIMSRISLLLLMRVNKGLKDFLILPSQHWKIPAPPRFSSDVSLLLCTENQANESEGLYLRGTLKSWHDWQCLQKGANSRFKGISSAQQLGTGLMRNAEGGWSLLRQQLPLMIAGTRSQGRKDPCLVLKICLEDPK